MSRIPGEFPGDGSEKPLMKCQSCQTKTARVHLTEIGSKMKKEIHLCEDCAREHEASLPHSMGSTSPSGESASVETSPEASAEEAESVAVCSACGISFGEFRSTGRLGCAEDYENLRSGLLPILEKIHGAKKHRGKVPNQTGERTVRQRELMKLTAELERAVKKEDYEEAARLRDRLKGLREKLGAD